ncbi:MAG: hypothetical protein IJV59_09250 [Eubacterium sp.]|nr:hypothetical protein [Eubacterium sp.]
MAYELYEAKSGDKELLMVPGAGHTQAVDIAPEEYFTAIEELIGGML